MALARKCVVPPPHSHAALDAQHPSSLLDGNTRKTTNFPRKHREHCIARTNLDGRDQEFEGVLMSNQISTRMTNPALAIFPASLSSSSRHHACHLPHVPLTLVQLFHYPSRNELLPILDLPHVSPWHTGRIACRAG